MHKWEVGDIFTAQICDAFGERTDNEWDNISTTRDVIRGIVLSVDDDCKIVNLGVAAKMKARDDGTIIDESVEDLTTDESPVVDMWTTNGSGTTHVTSMDGVSAYEAYRIKMHSPELEYRMYILITSFGDNIMGETNDK